MTLPDSPSTADSGAAPQRGKPDNSESKASHAIAGKIDSVLAEYLRGQVTVMAILAVFYAAALCLAGLQFAVPIGVLTGLLIFVAAYTDSALYRSES